MKSTRPEMRNPSTFAPYQVLVHRIAASLWREVEVLHVACDTSGCIVRSVFASKEAVEPTCALIHEKTRAAMFSIVAFHCSMPCKSCMGPAGRRPAPSQKSRDRIWQAVTCTKLNALNCTAHQPSSPLPSTLVPENESRPLEASKAWLARHAKVSSSCL